MAGCKSAADDSASTDEHHLAEGDAIVNTDALNLREGPGTEHAVIVAMPRGSRVHVTGEAVNGFSPVTFGEHRGWAFTEYLTPVAPIRVGNLADTVNAIAAEAPSRSPGTELGIAVFDFATGEYAGAGDDVRHVSASSAKVIWVTAAMHAGADVSDIAHPIFENSDNNLSGTAIDRAGGIDAVNEFYWNVVGMEHSITANWSFGQPRVASNQGLLGGDNYFTPKDVITFFQKLERNELVGDRTEEIRGYMKLSPRSGYGGWIGTLLPAEARASVMHKAGWLPPPAYPEYSTLNDIGIVQTPSGGRYAIALLAHHGQNYDAQARYVERASCVVYRTIARDSSLGCRD
jgi:beta-lactamase class A